MKSDAGGSSPANLDMERLMTRYQQADSAAAAALVELMSPQLCRFFSSQMGSRTEAEDMLQDVFTACATPIARASRCSLGFMPSHGA